MSAELFSRLPDELLGAGFEFVRLVADKTNLPQTVRQCTELT